MLENVFMQRAFIVGLVLAVIIPCIGVVVVLRRLSMIGDALSHVSLAGVAAGLLMGVNPIAGAMCACILASLGIDVIRRRFPRNSELGIAVTMSAGIGLAGVLSGLGPGGTSFNSFLFGSIVAISPVDVAIVCGVGVCVLAVFTLLYRELFYVTLDEQLARLSGVRVGAVNFAFTLLTAATVSVSSRTVGALIVSSLMVLPVACAMQIAKSFRGVLTLSIGFGAVFMAVGLTVSYYLDLRPGATVVLVAVLVFVLMLLGGFITGKRGAA